jgi:prophage tail gpP-like protein
MSLSIRFNGQDFQNFTDARVILSMDRLCGAFSFSSTANENESFPIPAGNMVECLADGQKILTGYIDTINVDAGSTQAMMAHNISISGRGRLQDLVDSTIKDEYTGDLNFVGIARYVLDTLGLNDVKIINKIDNLKNFSESIMSAETGVKAFEFLQSYAKKKQLLLNEDADGHLVVQRASQTVRPVYLRLTKLNAKRNNIKKMRFRQDFSNRYNKYIYASQANPALLAESLPIPQVVDQTSGFIIDKSIRSTRQVEINADEDLFDEDLKNLAIWEANIRQARGFYYMCEVSGHIAPDGKPWAINELVNIYDEFAHINSELLIKELSFDYSLDGGSTTIINFAPRNAYQVFVPPEPEYIDEITNQQGEVFSSVP